LEQLLDVNGAAEWRLWLSENHLNKDLVWLVFYKQGSGHPSISYDDAVDEALAFGWIDSVIKKIDERRYARKFTPRRPGSVWSKYNLARVKKLNAEGRMTRWGLEAYRERTGEISLLEQFNEKAVRIPSDLTVALGRNRTAFQNFERMAPSHRKRYLMWIAGAKKPETRKKRIAEAVVLISRNVKDLLK